MESQDERTAEERSLGGSEYQAPEVKDMGLFVAPAVTGSSCSCIC